MDVLVGNGPPEVAKVRLNSLSANPRLKVFLPARYKVIHCSEAQRYELLSLLHHCSY